MLGRINSPAEKVLGNSGVGFVVQPVGRKLVKLTKEGLQKDEEQNMRFMTEKIVEIEEGPYKWSCLQCSWKGKYLHKAKMHARDCGSRVKERRKRSAVKKFECSGCTMAFSMLSELKKHYRYTVLLSHYNL